MAAVTSAVGMQAATQAALGQLKLRQAQQNAERAEQVARTLRAKATAAQRDADRAQEHARALSVESDQAQNAARQARQGVAMIRAIDEMKASLRNTLTRGAQTVTEGDSATAAGAVAPMITTRGASLIQRSGQLTGTRVDTYA